MVLVFWNCNIIKDALIGGQQINFVEMCKALVVCNLVQRNVMSRQSLQGISVSESYLHFEVLQCLIDAITL